MRSTCIPSSRRWSIDTPSPKAERFKNFYHELKTISGAADIRTRSRLAVHHPTKQADGIAQVNLAVNHIDQATQQNAALVEQAAAAAESLREQARNLVTSMSRFKLRAA